MKQVMMRVLLPSGVLIGCLNPTVTFAICSIPSTTQMVTMDTPSLIIQADARLGTVLATGGNSYNITCNYVGLPNSNNGSAWNIFLSETNVSYGGPVNGYSNVVPTLIPGIGLRWRNITSNVGPTYMTNVALNTISRGRGIPSSRNGTTTTLTNEFELIKIGDINTELQSVKINDIAMRQRTDLNDYIVAGTFYTITFPVMNITFASCTLNQNVINVNLGDISKSKFVGINSISPSVPFSIDLNCVKGTNVKLTLDNTNAEAGFTGTIKLSNDSTASGVGVQIRNQNNISMVLGSEYPITTATTDNQQISIPFLAHYIQTKANINPGRANATLNFVLKYY